MKRNWYLLAIIFVALGGVLASVIIFPFYEQVSLMLEDEGQYSTALRRYQDQLEQGETTLPLIAATVKLLKENGRDLESTELVEKFVDHHPNDPEALAFLALQYKLASRYSDEARILQRQYKIAPSQTILAHLAGLYELESDHEHEQQVLEDLVYHYRATTKEHFRLAYFYAKEGRLDRAEDVMRRMVQNVPLTQLTYEQATFGIRVFAARGNIEGAAQIGGAFITGSKKNDEFFNIISLFADDHMPKQGLALLELLPPKMRNSNQTFETRFMLLQQIGDTQAGFDLITRLYEQKKLTPRIVEKAIPIVIQIAPADFIVQMLSAVDLQHVGMSELMDVAMRAIQMDEPSLAEQLRRQLGESYLQSYPALLFALALGAGDISEAEATEQYNQINARLTGRDQGALAPLLEVRGLTDLAQRALHSIHTMQGFPPGEIFHLAVMLVSFHMEDMGIELVEPLKRTLAIPPIEVDAAWMLFRAAKGDTQQVLEWLSSSHEISADVLRGVYEAAYKRRYSEIALRAAEKLYKMYSNTVNEALLASAQVISGDETGLETLRRLFKSNSSPETTILYVEALAYLENTRPELRTELTEVIQHELVDPNVRRTELRNLGSTLIDEDLKELAEPIFRRLSLNAAFASSDMQALLGIWGAHPKPAQAHWMAEQALTGSVSEEANWVKYLTDIEHHNLVLDVVKHDTIDDLSVPAIADAHFIALLALEQKEEAMEMIDGFIADEATTPKRLVEWAKLAQDASYIDGAENLFMRALELEPDNLGLLRELGLIAFSKGDYCSARFYLTSFLAQHPGDPRVYYTYGEILLYDKCYDEANCFFWRALDHLLVLEELTFEENVLVAQVYDQLEYYSVALDHYYDLLESYPDKISLYSEVAQVLMTVECYDEACRMIMEGFAVASNTDLWEENEDAIAALHIARLQLLKVTNEVAQALCEAADYVEVFPGNASLAVTTADLELAAGDWRATLCWLDRAIDLEPNRTILSDLRDAVFNDHDGFVLVNEETRSSLGQHEQLERFHIEDYVWPCRRLYVHAENDHVFLRDFIHFSTGDVTVFDGYRQRGVVGILQDLCGGGVLDAAMLLGQDVIGAGLKISIPDPCGTTVVAAAYREPCWDLLPSTIQRGVRHHAGIARTQKLYPRTELYGSLTYSQFDLEVDQKAATSYTLQAGVLYRLSPHNCFVKMWGRNAEMGLNYTLDKEHVLWQLEKTTAAGTTYIPLGLSNREMYTADVFFTKKWSECWFMEGALGYGYDYAASHGGIMGNFGLVWGKKGCFQARLFYYHSVSSEASSSAIDSLSIDLRQPF
ncbi:MAG: hypothetical protein Q8K75_03195 [Chlamydiales bacterium]|nr:hypothetical protein [Chlamydiales bacterium]